MLRAVRDRLGFANRALLGLLVALGGAAPAAAEPPALTLSAPAPETVTHLPLVEVAGGAGRGAGTAWDLAIVLDLSESTLHASGLDLDLDGAAGRSDPALLARVAGSGEGGAYLARRLGEEIDFEDTILAAELEAARALVARVSGPRLRTGLVAFSNDARVLAPLGSTPAVLEHTLDGVPAQLGSFLRGTHYAAAIAAAQALLVPDPEAPPDGRARAIVFLSDGAPSLPVYWGDGGRRDALEAARAAGLAGIQLFAFAFGDEAGAANEVLAQMAEWTEGRSARVEQPEQLVSALRELNLVDVSRVVVRNATTGVAARALRLFPDGSFDALVPLAEGANVIRIEAFGGDGTGVAVERTVQRLSGATSAEEATRGRALLTALKQRTAEMEAWAEVEQRRQQQRRSLTIEAAPGSDTEKGR
jgi:hypothetical protein